MVQRALLTHGLGSYSGSRGAADWFHAFERTAAPRLGGRFPVHLASPLQHAGASEWELGSGGGAVGLRYHLNRGCGADDRDCGPDHFFPLRAARVLPSPAAGGRALEAIFDRAPTRACSPFFLRRSILATKIQRQWRWHAGKRHYDALHLSAEGYALWDRWLTTALANEDCLAWLDDSCIEVPSL